MGEKRQVKGLSGVGIPGRLFTWANRDTSALSFVEANPQPGNVERVAGQLGLPSIRGAQDTSLDLAAVKTGNPGIHPAAGRFAYRATGSTYWRGYTRPNIQSGWDLLDGEGAVDKYADTARIPATGEVVFVTSRVVGIVEAALRCHVWTPSTNTWAAYSIRPAPPSGYTYADVAVAALLDGRLICIVSMINAGIDVQYEVHTSTDSGQTWSRYEEDAITIAADTPIIGTERGMLAVSGPEEALCWVRQYRQQSTGDMRIFQYTSQDYGATYDLVREWVTPSSTLPADLNLLSMPDRRLMLIYRTAGALLKFRVIGHPGQAFEDVEEQALPGLAQVQAVAAHVDEDGTIHVYAEKFSFTDTGELYHWTSANGGATWTTPVLCWNTTSPSDYPERMVSVSGMGQHFLGMQHIADVGGSGTAFGAVRFGGWSEPEEQDLAIPETGTTANHVLLINPFELPFNMGAHWTRGGVGGTWALGAANASTSLTLTGAADYVSHDYGAGFVDYFVAIKGEVISGGGLTALDLGLELSSSGGGNRYFARINFSQTGTAFRVAYNEGGSAATVDTAWDFSVLGRVHIRVSMDTTAALLDVWYKSTGAISWSRVAGAPFALVTAASGANSQVFFGSTSGTASVSEWEIGQVGVGSTGTLGLRVGTAQLRGLAIGAWAYPVPEIGPDTQIARLVNLMGPIFVDQLYTIAPVSAHPISNCYPDVTQKRRRTARTFDTGEHIVAAWDVGDGTAFESMYMYVDGNVVSAVLEATETTWAGTIDTIATYDPAVGFTAVAFNREGDSIKARTSGTSGARLLFNEEQREGWVDLGGGKLRKTRSNTAGEWTTGPHETIRKARIYLDGIDGTESTASNCTIYSPRGVVVAHGVGTGYKKFRVKLPAGANPWGYHELRYLQVGYLSCPGMQHATNWSWRRTRNAETRSDRAQSRYVVQTGSAPRFFSMSWPEGANMTQARNGNADFIAADTGNPLAVFGLVAGWAMGLPEETDSGARMIVSMPAIPKAGGTTTAPDMFCFGHLDSDISVTNALGQQGVNELERVDTVSVREGI